MFTGIIETTGRITAWREVAEGRRLYVAAPQMTRDALPGSSIAIAGVCLTVADKSAGAIGFDVIHETLERSTLGLKQVGDYVNLEQAVRAGQRLDGHFVQGHVDGVAIVDRVVATPQEHVLWLTVDEHVRPFLVSKGSIALDGVSLTIAEVKDHLFSVALIPTTLARTTLADLRAADRVNVESDIIARTVVHYLQGLGIIPPSIAPGLSMATLQEAGIA